MTRYLLDTTALVDFTKGVEPSKSRVLAICQSGAEVGVCDITITELYSGLDPADRTDPATTRFLRGLSYWPADYDTAVQAGVYRYDYGLKGRKIKTPDAIIAAVAAKHGAILVTDNPSDFPMSEVATLSVREEEGKVTA